MKALDIVVQQILADLDALGCRIVLFDGELVLVKPATVESPSRLARVMAQARLIKERIKDELYCSRCGRGVGEVEDRERLVGINPFCCIGGCVFRYSN